MKVILRGNCLLWFKLDGKKKGVIKAKKTLMKKLLWNLSQKQIK